MKTDHGGLSIRDGLALGDELNAISTSAMLDCQLLLAHVLGVERAALYAHPERRLDADQAMQFRQLLDRRLGGEPMAYIIGRQDFWTFSVDVTPATLIPRPETECLVQAALDALDPATTLAVADLGTGTGAIAIALCLERPNWQVIATDQSARAIDVARANANRLACNNLSFRVANWLEGSPANLLDAIVSNPPYIRDTDSHLDQLGFEPRDALVAGTDGLDAIRNILQDAPRILKPGGLIAFEHGYDQQETVMALLESAGFGDLQGLTDLAGQPRVALGRATMESAP